MPLIDFEGAWYDLKAVVAAKRSHSKRDLAEQMAEIELRHRVPDGQEGFDDRPPLLSTSDRHLSPAGDEPTVKLSAAS